MTDTRGDEGERVAEGLDLECRRIEWRDPATPEAALRLFEGCDACGLAQGWLPAPDPMLRPTRVQAGWGAEALYILADLVDDDPYNPVSVYNEPSFLHGDVVEIFLRPESQEAYYEFHITPANQTFQLRFPSAAAFGASAGKSAPPDWRLAVPVMRSRAWVLPDRKRWVALATIPLGRVSETEPVRPGTRWRFSFSRYDYTRGCDKPVLSSSSPHRVCNFHRQAEWGTLTFA